MQNDSLKSIFKHALKDSKGDKYVLKLRRSSGDPKKSEFRSVKGLLFLHHEFLVGSWFSVQHLGFISPAGHFDWKGSYNLSFAKQLQIGLGREHPEVLSGKRTLGDLIINSKIDYLRVYVEKSFLKMPEIDGISLTEFMAIATSPDNHYTTTILTNQSPETSYT